MILDYGNRTLATGLEIGKFLGELGEFLAIGIFGNREIFGFSNFHRSNLLDKRLAIGRILGNWEGFLVNWKIQNPNLHWKVDFGKLTGLRR
jgi:hypothetical protein